MRVLNIIKYLLFTWAAAQLVALMFVCSVAVFTDYWIIDITDTKVTLTVVSSATLSGIALVLQSLTKIAYCPHCYNKLF